LEAGSRKVETVLASHPALKDTLPITWGAYSHDLQHLLYGAGLARKVSITG